MVCERLLKGASQQFQGLLNFGIKRTANNAAGEPYMIFLREDNRKPSPFPPIYKPCQ